VIGEEAAEQRTHHRRDTEHRSERALIPAAVAQRNDLADEGGGGHHDGAAADALQRPRPDKHGHRPGQSAQHRADEEEKDRRGEDELAAEQVAQLADDRGDNRRGEQVAGHHPGLMAGAAEIRHHRRQRGGDDRLVQCGQQHAKQHRNEDQVAALRTDQGTARFGIRGGGRPRCSCHACLSSATTSLPSHIVR
jgi:hypothetical protein